MSKCEQYKACKACKSLVGVWDVRGFCNTCYKRKLKDGSLDRVKQPAGSVWISRGYKMVRRDGRTMFEHRIVMSKHLGRALKDTEFVHHINEDRADNRLENLYLCTNNAEHREIHRVLEAIKETGVPTSRKCVFCHTWDSPANMSISGDKYPYHKDCAAKYQRERKAHKRRVLTECEE